jgi:Domain of Unknown Function (DUF1080)
MKSKLNPKNIAVRFTNNCKLHSKQTNNSLLPVVFKSMARVLRFNTFILIPVIFSILYVSCASSRHSAAKSEAGYQNIFDGKTLDGWEFDSTYWRVENGAMVGEVTPANLLKRNSFIIKKDIVFADFELKVEYRISSRGNSGINYRSIKIDSLPYAMRGYQADINGPNNYTGQNYEERGRTTLAYQGEKVTVDAAEILTPLKDNIVKNAWTKRTVTASPGNTDSLRANIKIDDWNEYHLVIKGNRLLHYINGVLMSDVTDNDIANRKLSGSIGVQVHVGPPMKIEYRNFRIKRL